MGRKVAHEALTMCWLGAQIAGSRSWARQWPPKQTAGWQAREEVMGWPPPGVLACSAQVA